MAAAQATFAFPLLSLPGKHQLLVLSLKDNRTSKEQITFVILPPQKNDTSKAKNVNNIILPCQKSIKATLFTEDALVEFNRVFNKETKQKYIASSLQEKIAKIFNKSTRLCATQKEVAMLIFELNKTHAINLLNIKVLEKQFTQISIGKTTLQHMKDEIFVKTLHHTTDLLYNQMMATNKAIDKFLDQVGFSKASALQWSIYHLKINYDMEQSIKKHLLDILYEITCSSSYSNKIKEVSNQVYKNLSDVKKTREDLTAGVIHPFVSRCLLPEFDSQQEILSPEIKNRIYNLNNYLSQISSLKTFRYTLEMTLQIKYIAAIFQMTKNLQMLRPALNNYIFFC